MEYVKEEDLRIHKKIFEDLFFIEGH